MTVVYVWVAAISVDLDEVSRIAEIAIVITDPQLAELATGCYQVVPGRGWLDRVSPAQLQRLKRSGLAWIAGSGLSPRSAEEAILETVRTYTDRAGVVVAGINLGETIGLLDREMPNLAYWLKGTRFDITPIREVFRLAGRDDVVEPARVKERALDDLLELIDETRGYIAAVGCI